MAGYSGAAEGATRDALPETGRRLAWGNRRILAERQGWPAGALEACERLDRRFPRWATSWSPGSRIQGFERPPGFTAREWPPYADRYPLRVYGVTAEVLAGVLEVRTSAFA